MARRVIQLTDKKVKGIKPTEKEQLFSDGQGLQLRVMPNGTKSWRFVYKSPTTGKRANIALGTYKKLSIANARKKAEGYRELVALNIDPKHHEKEEKEKHEAIHKHTLFNVSLEWMEIKKSKVTENYAKDIWRSFELHVFPTLSSQPISMITAQSVIETLKVVEAKGSLETVRRLTQRLNEVMVYAMNCGLLQANPISNILAAFKKPTKQNMKKLESNELPALMNALANASIKRSTRCLIEFQLHTMTRPNEAAGAKWAEFDLLERVWLIPKERMKKRKEHRIPLTEEVINLLKTMRAMNGNSEYVFPSIKDPKKPMHSQTANMALKRMGFKDRLVSHGMRAMASTILNENGHDFVLVEAALAHAIGDSTQRSYNRTDYLERRRDLMDWWSKHIVNASQSRVSLAVVA
ncbi:tyrosine-type recombinase/integrase [Vibrio parahaemolyticus]|uniref:tyrosine-type recombinase/integrase n=1 Tax=Vibrio parahaemolyticus TaxID=670 RepID=UPI0011201C1C|nr:tyrosine-type recombinase/integrase [Vibrio parahaemolyticus]EJB8541977.1 tyrosine-type recombinase/integrase [Vibrio parahaemolyticus]MBE4007723.1 tyrosine-type recombinase/integrase [Vibrio parahaemolyticus]MBO0189575.1 tyrosine-type recombinase/integrase [Vibrio parahaemolyticus]MBO0220997.1 tyrosine-type recombinase/integrase [Vibrio parahaemolyticus]MDF4791026.1 tyrosine-type recombinase/integrase [Vibrio parahaemolyticus]